MISYFVLLGIFIFLFIIVILSKHNIIFKNNCIGIFFRSDLFRYILKRIYLCLFSIFLIMIAIFFLLRLIPMGYLSNSNNLLNEFNQPVLSKGNIFKDLINYLYNIIPFPKKVCTATTLNDGSIICSQYEYKTINLGYSYAYMKNVSVWTIIKEKCAISFFIGFIAYIFQYMIGFPLGVYISRKANKLPDKAINLSYNILSSLPDIIYFYLFLILFVLVFKLPVSFDINSFVTYLAPLSAIILWGSLSVAYWVKKYILLEYRKDYVKLAISKGLDEKTIFYKHILKNAIIPLIRTIPSSLALCLCGYYFLELIFNIPGISLTFMTAVNLQDVYLVQGIILFTCIFSIFAYLIGDLIALSFDKRIKFEKEVYNDKK